MMFTLMDVQFCLVIFHSLCARKQIDLMLAIFCKTLDICAYISEFYLVNEVMRLTRGDY